jgi:hypothetical protein
MAPLSQKLPPIWCLPHIYTLYATNKKLKKK